MLDLLALQFDEYLSWRWLLQVVLLSAGLTLAAVWGFRDDAGSRRGLGVAAVWLLALVPLVLLILQPRYQIGLPNPPSLPVLAPVPYLLLLTWSLVALWGCGKVALHVWQSQSRFRSLSPVNDVTLATLAKGYSERLGLATPTILYGENCCASSLGRDRLMVPGEFLRWPETAQRAVIAHELVHLSRRDDRFMIALQILARCYLFCPWLHLLYARFVFALEEACDQRAAELVGQRSAYLEGLAEAALREGGGSYEPAAHLIDAAHKSQFLRRLSRLLDKQRFFEVQAGPLTAGTSVGLLVLCALTTFEFVERAPNPLAGSVDRSLSIVPLQPLRSKTAPERMERVGQDRRWAAPEVQVIASFPTAVAARAERITPAVIYPGSALLDGIEGQVLMEFSIADDGSTVRAKVVRSTHPKYFNSAATRAVQQTVYTPNYKTGFSGVNAAYRYEQASARKAADRVQKLFVFRLLTDLENDLEPAPGTTP